MFLRLADKDFLKKLNGVCKINILTQAVIWVLGYGRVFTEYWGPTRYMGTFNDPNQYAFICFCMILLISLYACNYGDRTAPIYYCLGVFFMSYIQIHGHFLGLMLYTVGMAIWFYVRYRSKWNIPRKTEMTLGVVLILAAIAIVIKISQVRILILRIRIILCLPEYRKRYGKYYMEAILPCFRPGNGPGGIVS